MPASNALACGLCYEDNRAAVYTYEATRRVRANPDRLEFLVLKVKGALPKATVKKLTRWFSKREGVDSTTIRISSFQKSIGFVFKKTSSKRSLVSDLARDFPALSFYPLDYSRADREKVKM